MRRVFSFPGYLDVVLLIVLGFLLSGSGRVGVAKLILVVAVVRVLLYVVLSNEVFRLTVKELGFKLALILLPLPLVYWHDGAFGFREIAALYICFSNFSELTMIFVKWAVARNKI